MTKATPDLRVVAGVLAAHLLLAWLLAIQPPWRRDSPSARESAALLVRLLWDPPARAPVAKPSPTRPKARSWVATPAMGSTVQAAPSEPVAEAITVAPSAVSPPASAPLDLSLPRGIADVPPNERARVLNDPRVVHRPSFSERMSRALGTDGSVSVRVLPDGSRCTCHGDKCNRVSPSRSDTLDPYNANVLPNLAASGHC